MNKDEQNDFQRLVEEVDTAHAHNLAYFAAGTLVGIFLTIAWRGLT